MVMRSSSISKVMVSSSAATNSLSPYSSGSVFLSIDDYDQETEVFNLKYRPTEHQSVRSVAGR
jgi:hypothetical protein